MALRFPIKRHSRMPYLQLTVKNNGAPVDISGASSATFNMSQIGGAKSVSGSAIIAPLPDVGVLRYRWAEGDTDTVGTYRGEFDLVFPPGVPFTIPTNADIEIEVYEDVNDAA